MNRCMLEGMLYNGSEESIISAVAAQSFQWNVCDLPKVPSVLCLLKANSPQEISDNQCSEM